MCEASLALQTHSVKTIIHPSNQGARENYSTHHNSMNTYKEDNIVAIYHHPCRAVVQRRA